jgi:hypothetical protein
MKTKEQAEVEPVKLEPPAPLMTPLGDALGKRIYCPDCRAEATVELSAGDKARAGGTPRTITAGFWRVVKCKGSCGAKLFKASVLVELYQDQEPHPVRRELGSVVGHNVLCPVQDCGMVSRAIWDADELHAIVCPVHQTRGYPSSMMVVMA